MPDIIYTTSRCKFDEFYHQTMLECVKYAPEDSQIYYIWANPLSDLESLLEDLDYSSNNMLLFIPDNLTNGNFQPNDQTTWGIQIILNHVKKYPDKKFVLITDVHNLDKEYNGVDNLSIVETDLITMEKSLYQKVEAVVNKNLQESKHYITMANRASTSRITLFSYLLGKNLEEHGILKISDLINQKISNFDSYLDVVPWIIDDDNIRNILESGYQKLKTYQETVEFNDNHSNQYRHNIYSKNFDQYVRKFYSTTVVEICNETYFEEPSHMLTEKTLNMILGCNFPILLCGQGSVEHLESLGFDVFRDIVDHSYDNIQDPMARLTSAVDLNIKLLTDKQWATSQWTRSIDRFEKNVKHSKQGMYDLIKNRAVEQFKKILL